MRHFLITTAILVASPALAERYEAAAPVRAATIYPQGASVTREVTLDLPQGAHELVIPGLPDGTDPATLRVNATGAVVGAVGFQQTRALPATPAKSPALTAAEDEVRRLETALAERDANVARIRARSDAAEDTVKFLMALAESDGAGSQDIAAIASAVGQQVLQARQTMIEAQAEIRSAQIGRDDQVAELERAQARLDALRAPDGEQGALVIAVQGQGGPATLRISSMTDAAGWQPVYDLSLSQADEKVVLDRGLLVAQETGEDWSDVRLVLSTAQPLDRAHPSELSPMFPRIGDEAKLYSRAAPAEDRMAEMAQGYAPEMVPAPEVAPSALQGFSGETVVYDYPRPVNLRDGADALRLPMGAFTLDAKVLAEAVPRGDDRAFLVADVVNTSGAIILPGDATFHVDGGMVGRGTLELTAAGDEATWGFGKLNGILVERRLPTETEGGSGIISRSSERREEALLRIRNLTDREWPLRVIDQVPVSTQKDLRIDWTATPAPDETDPDGKRGLLVWNRGIAAGETQDITLTTTLRWPEGQVVSGPY
ncbi:DUF4139 domain-containing protein [Paracoccus laeviglucosivorans]|uniref:DUF4139 domain-containing protein n=1 Tax=Paracoccus laeviglucosivorans TaxID=1197861 RepID=A0A521DK01_9RHOB|nr:DUF4139 domain-containing protein [Paracoccus laeviglucosivorans]SMO72026.1 conserved hypothetical protein [Paracoccus laeviglucosivorans]